MPKTLMVVLTEPTTPEQTAEFERWYNTKHLPDIAAMPGVISATRYRIVHQVPINAAVTPDRRQSLALYEVEAATEDELRRFVDEMTKAMQAGKVDVSPALNTATSTGFFAIAASERVSRNPEKRS